MMGHTDKSLRYVFKYTHLLRKSFNDPRSPVIFFKKIIMTRERLRVMEQKINNHNILSEEDKIILQQYITKIYGSLTTFNILFDKKEHYFVGEKGT